MAIDFQKNGGLVPGIVQDAGSGRVLMLGFLNEEAWNRTRETGCVTFYSRSRNKLWMKGETSGHRLLVRSVQLDCDADALLFLVEAQGPGVCHTGHNSCFYRTWDGSQWQETEPLVYDPKKVYGG